MVLKIEKKGLIDQRSTYDLETGEVEEGALVWIPHKVKSRFGRDWFQMAQNSLKIINSHRKELGLEGIVVFNALMARLDFENYIQVSQADIAAELDMKAGNVSRAITKLIALGFVRKGPKVGRSLTYQLHPELAWKGKPKEHFSAQQIAKQAGWTVLEGGANADQPSLPFDEPEVT